MKNSEILTSCLARTAPAVSKARTLTAMLKIQTVLDFYGLLWATEFSARWNAIYVIHHTFLLIIMCFISVRDV